MTNTAYTLSTQAGDVSVVPGVRFAVVIEGTPRALGRPVFRHQNRAIPIRRNQVRVVNPSLRYQLAMRNTVLQAIAPLSQPFFGEVCGGVTVNLQFFMPRPNHHFRPNCPRQFENLKVKFQSFQLRHVDNLVKFVLDHPLSGTIFSDDKIVTKLNVTKKYDSVGDCRGRTAIEVLPNVIDLAVNLVKEEENDESDSSGVWV